MIKSNHSIEVSWVDYPDNESLSVNLYMTGCSNNCVGCHNSSLADWHEVSDDVIGELISQCKKHKTNKIVLLGGDPCYSKNLFITKKILKELSEDYNICVYTGHDVDYVKHNNISGFTFLKCGVYDESKHANPEKTDEFIQFSTTNQELYDKSYKLLSNNGRYYFIKETTL